MTRANKFAYPVVYDSSGNTSYGITIREHFAAMAMQGLISTQFTFGEEIVAKIAVIQADALLAELAKVQS